MLNHVVALVTGASRGAGRGVALDRFSHVRSVRLQPDQLKITVWLKPDTTYFFSTLLELGAAGATVYVTGRTQ